MTAISYYLNSKETLGASLDPKMSKRKEVKEVVEMSVTFGKIVLKIIKKTPAVTKFSQPDTKIALVS
jgi:hypothetical protein